MGQIKVEKNVGGIEGLCVIEPAVHGDNRGYFMETYNQKDMHEAGLDIVFGCYYITQSRPGVKGEGMIFASPEEARIAYLDKIIDVQAEIYVRITKVVDGKKYSDRIKTTVGRLIFNEAIPQNLGFVDRTKPENICALEINKEVKKKDLSNIVERAFYVLGTTETADMVDRIKAIGYKYSTLGCLTINAYDMKQPKEKEAIMAEAEAKVLQNEKLMNRGLITPDEKLDANIAIWNITTCSRSSCCKPQRLQSTQNDVRFWCSW